MPSLGAGEIAQLQAASGCPYLFLPISGTTICGSYHCLTHDPKS